LYIAAVTVAGPYYTNTNPDSKITKFQSQNPRHYTLLPNVLQTHFILGSNLQQSYPNLITRDTLQSHLSSFSCGEPSCQQASQAFLMGVFPIWKENMITPGDLNTNDLDKNNKNERIRLMQQTNKT
jgi:hypothetical protein